jgi:methylmalonyl-CoA mutase C-terminal domain/subunit
MTLFPEVVKLLKKRGAGDIVIAGGGIIPEEDVPRLKKAGIKEVFGPGTPLRDIVQFFETAAKGG